MSFEPGTKLGSYEVVAEIGRGGMGEVYRARDTKLDRDMALKVLPQAFTDDPIVWRVPDGVAAREHLWPMHPFALLDVPSLGHGSSGDKPLTN